MKNDTKHLTEKMKFILIIILFCSSLLSAQDNSKATGGALPAYLAAQNDVATSSPVRLTYDESYKLGVQTALKKNNPNGWLMCGLLAGAGMNVLGMAIIYGSAGGNVPEYIPSKCNDNGFRAGYYTKSKTINKSAAVIGAAISTAAWVGLIVYKTYDMNNK